MHLDVLTQPRRALLALFLPLALLAGCTFAGPNGSTVHVTIEPAPAPVVHYAEDGTPLCGPGAPMTCKSSQLACDRMNGAVTEAEYQDRYAAGDFGGVGDCNIPDVG